MMPEFMIRHINAILLTNIIIKSMNQSDLSQNEPKRKRGRPKGSGNKSKQSTNDTSFNSQEESILVGSTN